MNKKLFGFMFSIIVLAVLTAPVLGAANTGKRTTKQEFVFHLDGYNIWVPEATYVLTYLHDELNTIHAKGEDFVGVFSIEIGPSGAVETISNDYIEYTCELKYNFFMKTYTTAGVLVREVISIYNSDVVHDETTLRGTLVIKAVGQGQGSFVGFGTDEFEGLTITGFTEQIDPSNIMDRVGTVMGGWPT